MPTNKGRACALWTTIWARTVASRSFHLTGTCNARPADAWRIAATSRSVTATRNTLLAQELARTYRVVGRFSQNQSSEGAACPTSHRGRGHTLQVRRLGAGDSQ